MRVNDNALTRLWFGVKYRKTKGKRQQINSDYD